MSEQSGGQGTTADVSESELQELKVDELRDRAQDLGVEATSGKRKQELVDAVVEASSGTADGEDGDGDAGAGPDGGHVRTGSETSRSIRYSQEITSPDDDPERPGRSLVTTHHGGINEWAEAHDALPATVDGTEQDGHLGVLRLDFGGDSDTLRHVSWDEWFETFDARRLNFIYQEERKDGSPSTFFRLESPDREDG